MNDLIITTLLQALAMSLFCLGIYNTVKPGRIFGKLGQWAENKFNELKTISGQAESAECMVRNSQGALAKCKEAGDQEGVQIHAKACTEQAEVAIELYVKASDLRFLVWLLKPILLCPSCFATFWGSIAFWLLQVMAGTTHWTTCLGIQWALAVLICCAINTILHQIQLTLRD